LILLESHPHEGFSCGRHDLFQWRLKCGLFSVYYDSDRVSVTLRKLRDRIRALSHELQQRDGGSVPNDTVTKR
jgi:hypothetical protein